MKIQALVLIAALSLSAPARAEPVKTIIADNSQECGIYRLALKKREDNERTAYRLAASYEAKGIKTRVIVIQPGQFVGAINYRTSSPAPIYLVNAC